MIWQVLFSKYSDVLPAFTCAPAIVKIWSIYLGVNSLRGLAKSEGYPLIFDDFNEKIIFLWALRVHSWP